MSKVQKQGYIDCLLSWREGMTLRNIKFCRGDRDVIREEEVHGAIESISAQRSAISPSTEPTRSTVSTLDVRQFVANM